MDEQEWVGAFCPRTPKGQRRFKSRPELNTTNHSQAALLWWLRLGCRGWPLDLHVVHVSPGAGLCGGPGLHGGPGLQLDQEELWGGLSGEGQPHEVLLHQGLWPQGGSSSRWTSRPLRPPSHSALWEEPNVEDFWGMLYVSGAKINSSWNWQHFGVSGCALFFCDSPFSMFSDSNFNNLSIFFRI